MMVGRAFETTVEDRNATNIASIIPERASRIWRCVMRPCCSTGAVAAVVVLNGSPVLARTALASTVLASTVLASAVLASAVGIRDRRGAARAARRAARRPAPPRRRGPRRPRGPPRPGGGRGRQGPRGGTPGGGGGRARGGHPDEAGTAVAGVGTTLDVAGLLQRGDLPADDGDVHARARGQGAAPL